MKYSPNIYFILYYFYHLIITFHICIQIHSQIDSSLGLAMDELVVEIIFLHVKLLILSL